MMGAVLAIEAPGVGTRDSRPGAEVLGLGSRHSVIGKKTTLARLRPGVLSENDKHDDLVIQRLIPNPLDRLPDPVSRVPSSESRVKTNESRNLSPSPESRVRSPGSQVPSPESRLQ